MGGGSKKAPEPTKFVSPAIDNSPATHPIPNFFGGGQGYAGGQKPQSPYDMMQMLQQAAAKNPFPSMLDSAQQAPLLRTEQNQQPDIMELLKILSQGRK